MRALLVLLCLAWPAVALAQADEGRIAAEFRLEMDKVKDECFDKPTGCLGTFVTGQPVHIALGSIAPQNGFAVGGALGLDFTPSENWRNKWNSDGVIAPTTGAWRAGTYFKSVRTAVVLPQPVTGGTARPLRPIRIHEYPVFSLYGQAISLPTIAFFGLGSDSSRETKTHFGMVQSIIGGSAAVPLGGALSRWNISLLGEANGRLVDLRSNEKDGPSIETTFSELDAPGLSTQPAFVQLGEGVRFRPAFFGDLLALEYVGQYQQYVATTNSQYSFRRWTVDLNHEFRIYRTGGPVTSRDTNGPNECAVAVSDNACPDPSNVTRDRWGTASVRVLASKSQVGSTGVVPFYLQRTVGGSDINGKRTLASFEDYRFRGPHMFLMQQAFEHSIFGIVGAWAQAEQAKVALQHDALLSGHWLTSYSVGVTAKLGGFPVVTAAWATGSEGHHIIVMMDTSLLGGGGRPSLY